MASKQVGTSTKHAQIKQASTQTFIAVAVASVIVSMSLVSINILWGTSKFNNRVHNAQESARDVLKANLEAVGPLNESFERLEIGSNLIPDQSGDKKNSEVILDALPSNFDFPELAASINNLAEKSGVVLESFSGIDLGAEAVQTSPNPEAQQIPFNLEVEGSYDSVSKFLRGIENSIRPIKVLTVGLTGTTNKLRATVTAETSYQPAFDLTIQKEAIQ